MLPAYVTPVVCAIAAALPIRALGQYASEVVNYTQGTGLGPSDAAYNDPNTALGAPERFTGDGTPYASVVSVYSPPFMTHEAVSLGEGGTLTVRFDQPIVDDPAHAFGVDLIVFGNAGFVIGDFPTLTTGNPATLLGAGQGKVEVSADGVNFYEIPGVFADQLFPTQGYLDGGPFDGVPGSVPSDFFKPVNPSLTLDDFSNRTYAEILALYDGSGGGLPIDLSDAVDSGGFPANLTTASYVRVSQVGPGDTTIEAFVAVPEPATVTMFGLLSAAWIGRRRPVVKRGA